MGIRMGARARVAFGAKSGGGNEGESGGRGGGGGGSEDGWRLTASWGSPVSVAAVGQAALTNCSEPHSSRLKENHVPTGCKQKHYPPSPPSRPSGRPDTPPRKEKGTNNQHKTKGCVNKVLFVRPVCN